LETIPIAEGAEPQDANAKSKETIEPGSCEAGKSEKLDNPDAEARSTPGFTRSFWEEKKKNLSKYTRYLQ